MGKQEMRDVLEKGNFITIARYRIRSAEHALSEWMEDGLAACQGMDLLISGSIGMTVSTSLAEKLHLPLLQAQIFPSAPTRDFPSVILPQTLPNLEGMFNLVSSRLISQMTWLAVRPLINRVRKDILGLPPA